MKRLIICDKISYAVTKREITDEGFLKVPGRVARAGTQQYLARELELTDRAPNSVVTIYRPPEEVFNASSLDSYVGTDVTLDHPSDLVNPDTYRDVTVGTVTSAGRQDGDFVVCDMIVKAKDSIAAVESGKVQLSAGYTALYDHAPGTTPDGIDYEFIQRDIKINHVALVDRARAGFQARLFDNEPRGQIMATVVLDSATGRSVEVADAATAALVEDTITRLSKRANDAEADKADAEKAKEKMEAEKDAANEKAEKAEKKSTDEAIAERIEAITTVNKDAAIVAGAEFTCDSLEPLTIKRAALKVARDGIDWDEKSDAYVEAAFDMATADAPAPKNTEAQRRQLAADAAADEDNEDEDEKKSKSNPRQKAADSMSNAWKATAGEQ